MRPLPITGGGCLGSAIYAGYAFAPLFFSLATLIAERPRTAVFGLLAWGIANALLVNLGVAGLPGVRLALGLAGAGAVISAAALIAHAGRANWLRYMGEHSIVVYLAFYWPMLLALGILVRLGWPTDLGLIGAIITAAGIAGAFGLQWVAARARGLRWLFERPRWAFLPGQWTSESGTA